MSETQNEALAVTIRAIATKELSKSNFNRVVGKNFNWNFKWYYFCNNYSDNSSVMV